MRLTGAGLNLNFALWINPDFGHGKPSVLHGAYCSRYFCSAESLSAFGHSIVPIKNPAEAGLLLS
jgi:hypothetical protein